MCAPDVELLCSSWRHRFKSKPKSLWSKLLCVHMHRFTALWAWYMIIRFAFLELYNYTIHAFKNISSFRKDQVTLFMGESLNRVLKQFIQKYWFVLEQNKCMSLWVSQWIIHTADLLKNNTDPFWNKTNEWVNQRIIHRMDLFKHTDSVK